MSQEEETQATVLNEAQATCNNRIDELEGLVARLQIRSEFQAIRNQRIQAVDQTSLNTHRQETTAALTEQVRILRDLLVQLCPSAEPTPPEPKAEINARVSQAERPPRRWNSRNPERRGHEGGSRICYIGNGPPTHNHANHRSDASPSQW
ncbi:hypothetical protein Bca4012_010279 [Brassica carinata]